MIQGIKAEQLISLSPCIGDVSFTDSGRIIKLLPPHLLNSKNCIHAQKYFPRAAYTYDYDKILSMTMANCTKGEPVDE